MTSASANDAKVSTAALVILALLTAVNLAILLEVAPVFQREYDKLPGHWLPAATLFVLQNRLALICIDAGIAVASCISAAFRDENAKWMTHCGLIWNALQPLVVGISLCLPLQKFPL